MKKKWFAGDFCPRDASCSDNLEDGAIKPSNGPILRTMKFTQPPSQRLTATVSIFKVPKGFYDAGTNPDEWAKCEGQLLPIAQNTSLFSLLGTNYGGDGRTTFGLPDLKNETNGPYYIYKENYIGSGRN